LAVNQCFTTLVFAAVCLRFDLRNSKVSIAQEDVELLMKNSQAVLTTDEIVMKRHFEKQAQAMEAHERRISSILSRNQGFWVSDFWAKVFCWVILVCFLLIFISYYLKTRL